MQAPPTNITVLAVFDGRYDGVMMMTDDGTPAVTVRAAGEGRALFYAFLPSLSYFKPAIPSRPIDICPRDGNPDCHGRSSHSDAA